MWSAVSALVGLAGLLAGWLKWRASELRRNDVFALSCQVSSALETLLIVSMHAGGRLSDDAANDKLTSVLFETGILIERGRIFFRNEVIDEFGRNKEPAYRGYRPSILDPIVVAHQISVQWPTADRSDRARMRIVAEDSLKKFVSLVQKEVGRSRTASADTKNGGTGAKLRHLLAVADERRVAKVLHDEVQQQEASLFRST